MKARLGFRLLVLCVIAALLGNMGVPAAQAQNGAPTVVSYQGQILVGGTAYTGTGYFKFAVVDAAGTTSYWSNDGSSTGGGKPAAAVQLAVSGGLFNVLLGDTGLTNMTALPASVFSDTDRWLRVWFSSDGSNFVQLSPDRRIAAVPYALQAQEAKQAFNAWTLNGVAGSGYQQRVSGSCATGSAIRVINTDGTVTCQAVGGGADWSLTGNAGTTPGTNYVGTSDNQALELKVNAIRALRLEPNATSPNLTGGYSGNWLAAEVYGATIGGGGYAGSLNRVTDNYGLVGGGSGNQAGDNLGTAGDKQYATVVGGMNNTASGAGAIVGGGSDNQASHNYTTIGGGHSNAASGQYATVGGGNYNIGSGLNAAVLGGANNEASGYNAAVGGGSYNTASNFSATVPGGSSNAAAGNYSFAAGRRAKANNAGCFVWADSTDADYLCSTDNRFAVRATGGVALDLDGGGSGLRLEPNASSPNLIGGYGGNSVTAGAYGTTIGGGGASAKLNRVTDSHGTVGGGADNQAGDNAGTPDDMTYATVGGGGHNTASGSNATVSGGYENTASHLSATVGGGSFNTATGQRATVAGGYLSDATGTSATVGGGSSNTAGGDYSTVGGGNQNSAYDLRTTVGGGYQNNAYGEAATVAGGWQNTTDAVYATVGGGEENAARGDYSTVPGGLLNTAAGAYSFAAGRRAQANNAGCFVWADSTDADFLCSTDNVFAVRATGGVNFQTGTAAMQVNGNTVWHAGNDGTGSTLDADLLDGQHASAFQVRVSGTCGTGNAIRVVNADGTVTCEAVGGSGWSLTGNAGTTPGTNYVGTSDNQALELKVNAARALRLEPNATSPNLIGGYSGNWLTSGVFGAAIGGGGTSDKLNRVTDNYGTVGGGVGNQAGDNAGTTTDKIYATVGGGQGNTASGTLATVGGGDHNTASGSNATVGGGYYSDASGFRATVGGGDGNDASNYAATVGGGEGNTASGERATVAGGRENTASAVYATVGGGMSNDASLYYATVAGGDNNTASGSRATAGGGQANVASGDYSTVPGGAGASAGLYGQMAHASGTFAAAGDAQASQVVLRQAGTMTAGKWYELFLDGSAARLTIASGRTMTFDILITARTSAGESAGYRIAGLIENLGGTTALIGTPVINVLGEDDTVWDAQVVADDSNDALVIQVQGNDETIRWVATVDAVEVAW